MSFAAVVKELLDLLAPPKCAGCGELCRGMLCPDCLPRVDLIEGPYCRHCGQPLPPSAHQWPVCGECRLRDALHLDGARSVAFHAGPLRNAVVAFKFQGMRELCQPLSEMLARRVLNEYARPHRLPFHELTAVVPVPLHPARRRWRGFDQARALSRPLARQAELALWGDVLLRVRNTAPQVSLTPAQRRDNVYGAFEARKPWKLKDATLLLVDDVYTTGATLWEAARALKLAGAGRVYGLTITRAAPDWYAPGFRKQEER